MKMLVVFISDMHRVMLYVELIKVNPQQTSCTGPFLGTQETASKGRREKKIPYLNGAHI